MHRPRLSEPPKAAAKSSRWHRENAEKRAHVASQPFLQVRRKLVHSEKLTAPLGIIYGGNVLSLGHDSPAEHRYLEEALAKPGLKSDARIEVPYDPSIKGAKRLRNGMGYYHKLCEHLKYPYYRADLKVFKSYSRSLANWLNGANYVETCIGNGEKTATMLKDILRENAKAQVKLIVKNDTERDNLRDSNRNIRAVANYRNIKIVNLLGDCLDRWTWQIFGALGKGWTYYSNDNAGLTNASFVKTEALRESAGDVLKALAADPARIVYGMFGVTANNHNLAQLLNSLQKDFKKGSLFLLSVDNTCNKKALQEFYDLDITKQLIVNGVSQHMWKNKVPHFDPRTIGAKIVVSRTEEGASVQFQVFDKENPENVIPFDPLRKISRRVFEAAVKAAGLEIVYRMSSKTGDPSQRMDHAIYALCHKGSARELRQLALAA
jgi:hypothetical protein